MDWAANRKNLEVGLLIVTEAERRKREKDIAANWAPPQLPANK